MASIIKRKYRDGNGNLVECDSWTVQYRDAAGRIKRVTRVPGTNKRITDKAVARQIGATLERQIVKGAVGLVDPFQSHKARPLAEHVSDYAEALTLAGKSAKYVQNVRNRLALLLAECRWNCTADISADGLRRFQQRRAKARHKGQQGDTAAAETLNQYAEAARAFCNWMATQDRMEGVPVGNGKKMATALAGIESVAGEKKRKRRALSDEQVAQLLAVTPETRKLVYRFGLATGLRRSEIERLQWGDVRTSAIKPYLQLRAEATKARRGDRVPLPATLADDLRAARPEGVSDRAAVFPVVPGIDEWKADLAAAGIPYIDDLGRQVDFHAGTRKTLCTRMHRQGVPLAIAQRIMRHADPRLTMEDYVDDEALGTADAVLAEVASNPAPSIAATAGA